MALPPPIPRPTRPVLVWVISIYFFISLAFTALSFWLIHSGLIPLPPAQRTYFNSLTWVDYGCTLLITVCNLAGALALLLLRRVTIYLFALGFIVSLGFTVYEIIATNWLQAMGPALRGTVIGWVIPIAVILYARNLANKGILR